MAGKVAESGKCRLGDYEDLSLDIQDAQRGCTQSHVSVSRTLKGGIETGISGACGSVSPASQ